MSLYQTGCVRDGSPFGTGPLAPQRVTVPAGMTTAAFQLLLDAGACSWPAPDHGGPG